MALNRTLLGTPIVLFIMSGAFAQSDEEILETLGDSITQVYLDQLPSELPKSFLDSGLAPADIEQLIAKLASDCAVCFVDAVVDYAAINDVPLSDIVADGVVSLDGDSAREFELLLNPCILTARQAAGLVE